MLDTVEKHPYHKFSISIAEIKAPGQESFHEDLLIFTILPKLVAEAVITPSNRKNYTHGCCYTEKSGFMAKREL
jgi:hypothetical protein